MNYFSKLVSIKYFWTKFPCTRVRNCENKIGIFFRIRHSFLTKCLFTDAKTQKIEPDLNFVMMDESFGGSVYLFFNEQKIVCND